MLKVKGVNEENIKKMDELQIHVTGDSSLVKRKDAEVKMETSGFKETVPKENSQLVDMTATLTKAFGNRNLQEKINNIQNVDRHADSNEECVKVYMQQTLSTEKDEIFKIKSNDLFLPKLKQIGQSLSETKEFFTKPDGVSVVPSACGPQLGKKVCDLLEKNNWFTDYDLLSRRSLKSATKFKQTGLIFQTPTMTIPFCIDTNNYLKDDIEADVIIILQNQPVLILTILGKDEQSTTVSSYNASITRGIVMRMGRFMDEGFKVAFGLVTPKQLESPEMFRSCLEEIVTSSEKYVTFRSIAMNPEKYEKVLTAFWASMTETKCVDDEEECIRFLTKDQSVILVEHLSRVAVEVISPERSGTSVLLAEVSRRLSHNRKTLFLCEKKNDEEKFKKLLPCVTTCTDVSDVEVGDFKCIVDETAHPQLSADFHWKRRLTDEPNTSEEEKRVALKKQRLSEEDPDTSGAGNKVPTSLTLHIKDRNVHLPVLELDKYLVNTDRCHITDDHVLVNKPLKKKSGPYEKLWGTSATLPAGGQDILYWEVHSKILPKDHDANLADDRRLQLSSAPLIETGLVKPSCIDKRALTFQEDGSAVLLLKGCETHRKFCLKIVKDKVETCTDEDIKVANDAIFQYGILYDRTRSRVAFRNVKTGIWLDSVTMETEEDLLPVFALTYTQRNKVPINLKLVCGSSIDVTDNLQSFFEKFCEEK